MKYKTILPMLLTAAITLSACGTSNTSTDSSETVQTVSSVDTSDMFTDRDMEVGYDEESCINITLDGDTASSDSDAVSISDSTITITEEGTYLISGTLDDGMIIVDVDDTEKVQLVLNGVDISNADSAAIYVKQADKVFITTAADSENTLSNGGEYVAIDDNNIDSVIFSKEDLTLNGEGTLTINAASGHGIVSKDDLVLTSGTYIIDAESHALAGKDSVRIAGGTYTLTSGKDGIHASNSDDATLGFVYISDGDFMINAGDDGIHADSSTVIEGGNIDIPESYEGIEGLSIDITGGKIQVTASDDGLNAAGGTDSSGTGGMQDDMFAVTEGAYINISGGTLTVDASGDGIDSNGDITVSGGETYVSGPADNGNGALDYNGTAIITGGIFVAAGTTGMAQNFSSDSTQGAMLVSVNMSSGDSISLTDENNEEILSWEVDKTYSSILISTPEITEGSTYTLTAGSQSTEITMDSLIYGNSGSGMGGPSGGGGRSGGGMNPSFGEGSGGPGGSSGGPGGGSAPAAGNNSSESSNSDSNL